MDNIPEDAPPPRLCHLVKWEDFDGYGFNLHGEKSKPGQYIGKVDKDSPAEIAGLKNNDRIIEVNGTNISNENHKQVVQRIKAVPDETKLLVLDEKAEEYYKSRNIVVTGTMANVKYSKTPNVRPTDDGEMVNGDQHDNHHHQEAEVVVVKTNGDVHQHHRTNSDEDRASHASDSGSSLASKNNSLDKPYRNGGFGNEDDMSSTGPSPTPPGSSASPSPTPLSKIDMSGKSSNSSLDLNMTVQEMRAKIAARKKVDPKSQKIDLRKKYEIIQTL